MTIPFRGRTAPWLPRWRGRKRVASVGDFEKVGGDEEMCEHFARGKGLEKALREYLEAHRGKLTEIEHGQHIPEFRIVAPSEPNDDDEFGGDHPADTGDFEIASSWGAPATGASDDDIPFASDEEIPFCWTAK